MSNNTPDYKDDIVFLPPETADEMADYQRAGQGYWNECDKWGTTTGEFGLIQVHRQRRGEGQL